MSTGWKPRKYKLAADSLRRLGYDITYKANDRKTFKQRGVIRRLYEQKVSYINFADFNTRAKQRNISGVQYGFMFQKLKPNQLRLAKKSDLFSKEQFTKGGVFIEKPVNMPASEYKVKFTKDGMRIKAGKRRDLVVKLDSKLLAIEPTRAVNEAIGKRKPGMIGLMVNGFSAKGAQGYTLGQFYKYLENELLPQWIERNEKYYDDEGEAVEQFTDIFHLKLLY